jgi:hypothetical protein
VELPFKAGQERYFETRNFNKYRMYYRLSVVGESNGIVMAWSLGKVSKITTPFQRQEKENKQAKKRTVKIDTLL